MKVYIDRAEKKVRVVSVTPSEACWLGRGFSTSMLATRDAWGVFALNIDTERYKDLETHQGVDSHWTVISNNICRLIEAGPPMVHHCPTCTCERSGCCR